jgi:hypothetical protein
MLWAVLGTVLGQKIEGCTGEANPFALVEEAGVLKKEVHNGRLYSYAYDGREMQVASVRGTAFEMGLAYGQLLKDQLPVMIEEFYGWAAGYIENNVTFINTLPNFMKRGLGRGGVAIAKRLLDLNYVITKKYTPARWEE